MPERDSDLLWRSSWTGLGNGVSTPKWRLKPIWMLYFKSARCAVTMDASVIFYPREILWYKMQALECFNKRQRNYRTVLVNRIRTLHWHVRPVRIFFMSPHNAQWTWMQVNYFSLIKLGDPKCTLERVLGEWQQSSRTRKLTISTAQ